MLTGMDGSGRLRASGGGSPGRINGETMCPQVGASPYLTVGRWSNATSTAPIWGHSFAEGP